jgi:hypothetical protein
VEAGDASREPFFVIEMSVPAFVVTRRFFPALRRLMVSTPMAKSNSAGKRPYHEDNASTVFASLLM